MVNLAGDRAGDLLRPGRDDQAGDLVGEIAGADEAGERRHHDEKREQRHQDRQRDVAGDRPAVIAVEAIEGFQGDAVAQADGIQCGRPRRRGLKFLAGTIARRRGARIGVARAVDGDETQSASEILEILFKGGSVYRRLKTRLWGRRGG